MRNGVGKASTALCVLVVSLIRSKNSGHPGAELPPEARPPAMPSRTGFAALERLVRPGATGQSEVNKGVA